MKSYDEIIKDIQRKIYYPVYFLSGEEPYYIDLISDYIEENLLQPEEKEFNLTVMYGRDTDAQAIMDSCKRFPMMSNYQLVIIKEAQDVKDIDALEKYIANPLDSTILVICYKYHKVDKRKTFAKLLEKKAVLFESSKVYDNQVPAWIAAYVKEHGYSIQQKAAIMMAEFLGADLSKIVNEVSKIIINYPKGSEITPEQVELNIGISKDFNVFELQKALGTKNVFKANQIIKYFAENEKDNPIVKVIPILFSYFVKVFLYHNLKDRTPNNVASALSINRMFIDDYATAARNYPRQKLRDIFGYLREYDIRSKGVGSATTNSGELMKEMVYKILH
ncbi:MAG TPA: DNA polymerase III subunit delta [Bacteroidales bacterium]|nr:DNA polymerase III subunit delta [Bacteroidales bacterium]